MAAMATRTMGMIHHGLRRRFGVRVQASPSPSPPSWGPASTISSVVSGLMVSLAVVVVAILGVLVLVFSDQPATQRVKGRRGRSPNGPRPQASGGVAQASSAQAASALGLRGPPPAHVLQQQLALPSTRPRGPGPAAPAKPLTLPTKPEGTYDVRLGKDEGVTFFTRIRSSVALLVLLTAVGTVVALSIGSVLYLAGLALRHTFR